MPGVTLPFYTQLSLVRLELSPLIRDVLYQIDGMVCKVSKWFCARDERFITRGDESERTVLSYMYEEESLM